MSKENDKLEVGVVDVSKESLMKSQKKNDDVVVNTTSGETILTEEDDLPPLLPQAPKPSPPLEPLLPDSSPTSDITAADTPADPASSPSDQPEQTEGPKDEDAEVLYTRSDPLSHRIERAIQRYKKNRKFNTTRHQILNSYLSYGGVNTSQKAFLGNDDEVDPEDDAEIIAAKQATDLIDDDIIDGSEVAFTHIAATYLSSYFIDKSGYVMMNQFKEAPEVLVSFLNYLIRHDVCPEHLEDMKGALDIAYKARIELPNCKLLSLNAPGIFNKACSLLFGGEYYGMFDNNWQGEDKVANIVGMTLAQAKRLFEKETGMKTDEVEIVREETKMVIDMEIISIEDERADSNGKNADGASLTTNATNATEATKATTNVSNATEATKATNASNATEATNVSNAKNTLDDKLPSDGPLRCLTLRDCNKPEAPEIVLRLGNDIAKYAAVGMRVIADFYKLSNGWWYWDRITNVYPSYYVPCDSDSSDED
ncbi:885_t:CDS:2 [Paraglomus brasilianum]|uniref:885_t:CDS:1 n=1 Tax=Paraglomus brasilianum TaxID=144538 RepID=A0A9N9GC47_9GLOM|nr:885_t:CDS:2 [Paraglomus brasilianum]